MELREGLPGPALTLPPAQRRGRTTHPAVLFAPRSPVRLGPPRARPTKGRDDCRLGLPEPGFTPDAARGERSLGQRQCPQLGAAGDEAPIVFHPEAEEGFVTDLLEGRADAGEPRHPLLV